MTTRPMTLAERKALRRNDREARYGIQLPQFRTKNAHKLMRTERRAWARKGLAHP